MENKSGLFQATAWYGIGNLFVRLVSFILLPLYSNLISVEHFGIYSLMMSTYAIAAVFYQFGMNASLTNFYLKEKDEIKRKLIFSTVINSIVLLGVLLTLIAFAASPFLSQKVLDSSDYVSLFFILFAIIFLETISNFILQLFKTQELSRKVVVFLIAGALLNLLLNIWFVYYLRLGINGIIYAQLFSAIIIFIFLLPLIKESYVFRIDVKILLPIILFSLPLFISGLFSSGMDVADRFILDHFLGKKEVGEYSFAYRIAMITNIFVISFRTAWIPYALNKFKEGNYRENFGKIFLKLLSIGAFILLTVTFFADDLFRINLLGKRLFNPDFQTGLIILPYVILGYIFSSIAAFYSLYPYVYNKSYHFLISDGIGLISNLVMNFLLIPSIGLIGAGISTCVSFLIVAVYLYLISREIKISYPKKIIISVIGLGFSFLFTGIFLRSFIIQIMLVLILAFIFELALKIKISKIFRFFN